MSNKIYRIAPYSALLIFLASCAQDNVEKVVTAANGGAAATGLSGGNILLGIIVFLGFLMLLFGGG